MSDSVCPGCKESPRCPRHGATLVVARDFYRWQNPELPILGTWRPPFSREAARGLGMAAAALLPGALGISTSPIELLLMGRAIGDAVADLFDPHRERNPVDVDPNPSRGR